MTNQKPQEWRRRYYHGVVVKCIAEYTKREPRLVHLWIKRRWNIETTTESDEKLKDLIVKIRQYMKEVHKFDVPLPIIRSDNFPPPTEAPPETESDIDLSFNF